MQEEILYPESGAALALLPTPVVPIPGGTSHGFGGGSAAAGGPFPPNHAGILRSDTCSQMSLSSLESVLVGDGSFL